jgi:hypothetical protein
VGVQCHEILKTEFQRLSCTKLLSATASDQRQTGPKTCRTASTRGKTKDQPVALLLSEGRRARGDKKERKPYVATEGSNDWCSLAGWNLSNPHAGLPIIGLRGETRSWETSGAHQRVLTGWRLTRGNWSAVLTDGAQPGVVDGQHRRYDTCWLEHNGSLSGQHCTV